MFGGGEEYFAEPKPVDKDTLYNLAQLNAKLRGAEKIGKKTVEEIVDLCELVGQGSMNNKELVIGCIFRHIKSWGKSANHKKPLLCWYVLDRVMKRGMETYGQIARQYIMEVATEHMPWEKETEKKEYHKLLESWDGVFPQEMLKEIFKTRKEYYYNLNHPAEAKQIEEDEEAVWKREEAKHQEEDGLDDYAEPCLAYLQGTCSWGSACTQLHPPGLEGTLPPECRLGDWRCAKCGTINRHFRRRCFNCPAEKPQYRKGKSQKTKEEELLSKPDAEAGPGGLFEIQFGYDPNDEAQAVKYWQDKFSGAGGGLTVTQWRMERSAAIRTKILKKEPQTELEKDVSSRNNWESSSDKDWNGLVAQAVEMANSFGVEEVGAAGATSSSVGMDTTNRAKKRRRLEYQAELPTIDPMPARDRVFFIVFRVLDQGMEHRETAGYLFLLSQALQEASSDPQFATSPPSDDALRALVSAMKMVFVHWNAKGKPTVGHVAVPLLLEVKRHLHVIPFTKSTQREEVAQYCKLVNEEAKK